MTAPAGALIPSARPAILDYFQQLDALLKQAVDRAREIYNGGGSQEGFHGLYISEQEIDDVLDRGDTIGSTEPAESFLRSCAGLPGIEGLSEYWQLTPFDHAAIILALAPELDLRYERIYAYLQDDVTRRKPTVDLALTLFGENSSGRLSTRSRFAIDAPLTRSGLLRLIPDPGHVEPPLLAHYLKLDESVVRLLSGDGGPDPRLASFCDLLGAPPAPELTTDALRRLPSFVAAAWKQGRDVRLLFAGTHSSSKMTAATAVASALRLPLLTADLSRHPRWMADPVATASMLINEAGRAGAVLHIEGLTASAESPAVQALLDGILRYKGPITVASDAPAAAAVLIAARFLTLTFTLPEFESRRALWESTLAAAGIFADPATVATLANRFKYSGEQIHAAVESARQNIEWRATAQQRPSPDDAVTELMQAAREQSGAELAALTSKMQPVYTWADIVLPDDQVAQLKEICQRVAQSHNVLESGGFGKKLSAGKGVAVLFVGTSGTGKTMAAEVIANELGLDLFRIDLSSVVSKYIGETEKNLERIFTAATRSNSVLLFDEADAICGKRSEVRDAHDRYANIEISYLLQKMEQYEGITILTTNLRANLDEAFVRRLAFTVHFPFPDERQRLEIWKQIWPQQTRLDPAIDFSVLAKHFKLSGGNIKNIALSTAFLAAAESRPVQIGDLLHATRREYEKVGKVLSTAEVEAVVH